DVNDEAMSAFVLVLTVPLFASQPRVRPTSDDPALPAGGDSQSQTNGRLTIPMNPWFMSMRCHRLSNRRLFMIIGPKDIRISPWIVSISCCAGFNSTKDRVN